MGILHKQCFGILGVFRTAYFSKFYTISTLLIPHSKGSIRILYDVMTKIIFVYRRGYQSSSEM